MLSLAHQQYNAGRYKEALGTCESIYQREACRTDNLLLLGAVHFQTRNFSECIFYNQQCVRVDPNFAEAYSNLGNALKELGDVRGAIQFYLKVWLASRCGALCGQLCEPKRGGGGVVARRSRAAQSRRRSRGGAVAVMPSMVGWEEWWVLVAVQCAAARSRRGMTHRQHSSPAPALTDLARV